MPKKPIGRPLAISDFADVHRIYPRRCLRLRNIFAPQRVGTRRLDLACTTRILAYDRIEKRFELLQALLVETRSNSSGIDERSVDEIRELKCAEVGAASFGLSESRNHEVAGFFGFDLEPVLRA